LACSLKEIKHYLFVRDMEVTSYEWRDKDVDYLPTEILRYCFTFLSAKELCRISTVCIKWRLLCTDNSLWKDLLNCFIPRGHQLSSKDSFLKTYELTWQMKYRLLTAASKRDIKFVFIGDCKVGKTKLVNQYLNIQDSKCLPTIHDTYSTRVSVGDDIVMLSLWDTSGDEVYDRVRPLSYVKADVGCITFSFDNYDSLSNITSKWYPEIRHFLPDIPVILIGVKNSKSTARPSQRKVEPADIKTMMKRLNVSCFVECDDESEICLNMVVEEGIRASFKRGMKKISFFAKLFKKKKKPQPPMAIKHLHYGAHCSHVGNNLDTGREEMWMVTRMVNGVTTLLYISY